MNIHLIAAVARNRAIGKDNQLLYWLPNDLKRFKQLTTGHTIIMGRRTYESLPHGALPNRRNIVLTRSKKTFERCECFTSLEIALAHCEADEDVFVIGGESVYKQAISKADILNLTEIDDLPKEADAFFPPYDEWQEVWRENHEPDERHQQAYAFVDYKKENNRDKG